MTHSSNDSFAATSPAPHVLRAARLPAWCSADAPGLVDVWLAAGRIERITAHDAHGAIALAHAPDPNIWHLHGAPVLPALVEPHAHLDKAYTVHRAPTRGPGLLAAIEASHGDERHWSAADLRARAERALHESLAAGVRLLRTHVSWFQPEAPLAWAVYPELRAEWLGRVDLECVNISPLGLFEDAMLAERIAATVAATPGGVLGGFVHTTNHSELALRNLMAAAARHGLRVDLHADEELAPHARGVASAAKLAAEFGLHGRVACSHACALAVQDPHTALTTLDAVARAGVSLISLPSTNLLLQDATTGRTPRLRGITLVHEALARGIPVAFGSDNVQDAFNPVGRHDPVAALELAVLAAHIRPAFDMGSALVCNADALGAGARITSLVGMPADLVIFPGSHPSAQAWPADTRARVVLRGGRVVATEMAGEMAGETASEWAANSNTTATATAPAAGAAP